MSFGYCSAQCSRDSLEIRKKLIPRNAGYSVTRRLPDPTVLPCPAHTLVQPTYRPSHDAGHWTPAWPGPPPPPDPPGDPDRILPASKTHFLDLGKNEPGDSLGVRHFCLRLSAESSIPTQRRTRLPGDLQKESQGKPPHLIVEPYGKRTRLCFGKRFSKIYLFFKKLW